MAGLQENPTVQELLSIMQEHQPEKAKDFAGLLWYVDGMERQFDAVIQELQTVKAQLAEVQDSQHPMKKALSGMAEALESKVEQMRERLHDIKTRIMEGASSVLDSVKQSGISALDKAVSFLGIRDGLDNLKDSLKQSLQDTKQRIEKVETIGQELRSVGTHVKNVGRAVAGAELKSVREDEGKFQAAVLAPLRTTQKLLVGMSNATLAAIGSMERLEQAAEAGQEIKAERKAEKASILQDLQKLKAEAASRPAPVPEKKPQEAAL